MRTTVGLICIVLGGIGWLGQLISAVCFERAQQWGLQEKSDHTDPLYRTAELNAARWDTLALWTIMVAGILIVFDHSFWPLFAMLAGGVSLDAGGREAAKYYSLTKHGVRVGSSFNIRLAYGTFASLIVIGLVLIVYAMYVGIEGRV